MNSKKFIFLLFISFTTNLFSQSPAITSWLQNTTLTGTYYNSGSSTAIGNGELVNCQKVEYSNDYVYVTATGIPSFTTGPFLDGNPPKLKIKMLFINSH